MATEKCTLIPEQLFESQDAFIAHVKHFAMENGFNVRLDDVERDKGGTIRKRDIVCSSEGTPRGKESTGNKREDSAAASDGGGGGSGDGPDTVTSPRVGGVAHSGAHRRKSMKTGCRWLARASRQASGMWKIILLRLEHNHPLAARYELMMPSAHTIRTGDNASISAAALAARDAAEKGIYHVPSTEFKNLFLQMSAACADLCWSAARHPHTIAEVLSEIRRLNHHLDRHNGPEYAIDAGELNSAGTSASARPGSALPTISEDTVDHSNSGALTGDSDKTATNDGSLMMMANGSAMAIDHRNGAGSASSSQPHAVHFLDVARATSQHNGIAGGVAQSPELSGTGNVSANSIAAAAGAPDTALSPVPASVASSGANASSSSGPIKRARGRPRKNPLTAASEGKSAKSKPSQKRGQQKEQRQQQQQQQQQQLAQVQPKATPTPADLASLSHQIISQNSASTSSSVVQRSINSSLALPSQPMQVHSHAGARASILAGNPSVPPAIDGRSHAGSVQRQPQQPQPQPQQSPTFFLGAAEGNGYSRQPATSAAAATASAAAGVEYANTPPPPAAAAATATTATYSDVSKTMGNKPTWTSQKSAATSRTAATTATTAASASGVLKHAAAISPAAATAAAAAARTAAADAPPNPNALRRHIPPPAIATVPPAAATEPVPRSAAVSAISNPAANASSSVDFGISSDRPRSAVPVAATTTAAAATLPVYQTYQQQQQQQQAANHHVQHQDTHAAYYQRSQTALASNMESSAPVSTLNHILLSSNSSIPGGASAGTAVATTPTSQQSYHYQQQQQQSNMFHINSAMQATHQVSRGSASASFNPYLLMSRTQQHHRQQQQDQQQQDQQQQHSYHVQKQQVQQQAATATPVQHFAEIGGTHHHQQQQQQQPQQSSPVNAFTTLPSLAHNGGVLSEAAAANRRLGEFHLNPYQNMNNWQV
ncbi:hypothetical protein H4217_007553 [Coemansia sp. RSA 1939]|nr:hypothetical protein H4217_007553 [Coemansia sp. RSA 1939]KAJ2597900.1 hypothetical protein EV177_007646 [Coemansia sp. RSA 1804]